MSAQAVAYVQRVRWESANEFLVMLALADSAGRSEWLCSEPQEALAERAYMSLATLKRTLSKLRREGDLERVRRGGRDARGAITNVWKIVPIKGVTVSCGPESGGMSTAHSEPPLVRSTGGSSPYAGGVQFGRQQESNGTAAREGAREGSIAGGDPRDPRREAGAAAFAANPGSLLGEEIEVDRIWKHYVEIMGKRRRELPSEERKLIVDALKVATPDEICEAIDGCASSDFHMGRNDRGRKYNALPQIIKARRGKVETTRSRIEFFLELAGNGRSGGGLASVDRAKVDRAKRNVLDAHEFPGDDEAQRRGAEAENLLREQGIWVKRSDNGRPTFE